MKETAEEAADETEETAVEAEEKPEEFQVSGYNNGTGIGPGKRNRVEARFGKIYQLHCGFYAY